MEELRLQKVAKVTAREVRESRNLGRLETTPQPPTLRVMTLISAAAPAAAQPADFETGTFALDL